MCMCACAHTHTDFTIGIIWHAWYDILSHYLAIASEKFWRLFLLELEKTSCLLADVIHDAKHHLRTSSKYLGSICFYVSVL